MPQDEFRIFLSAVTNEFGMARDALAADLRSPHMTGTGKTVGTFSSHSSRRAGGTSIGRFTVASLMISCPNTGQAISTGIETNEHSLRQIADVRSRTRCPNCGLVHTWWKGEAWLADTVEQPKHSVDAPSKRCPRP
jgi:hypothetical protein